jgi:hypothetical protein
MARKREIRSQEAKIWLGVLLDAAFDPTSKTLNLARSAEIANQAAHSQGLTNTLCLTARDGQSQLLALASDFVNDPEGYTDHRQAELLLDWVERWMQPEDWARLQARVRKRRALA